jgi:hypothetical protein
MFNIRSLSQSLLRGLRPIAQTALRSIGDLARNTLRQVAGDIFSGVKQFATNLFSRIPDPIKNLFGGLLNSIFPGLNLGQLMQQASAAASQPHTTTDSAGNTVNVPSLPDRGNTANVGSAQTAFNTALSSVTGGSPAAVRPGATASTGAASTSSGSSDAPGSSYSSFDSTGGVTIPSMPSAKGRNLKDPNVMADYQEQMQWYTQMLMLRSQIQSMMHDTRKQIVQNMRA